MDLKIFLDILNIKVEILEESMHTINKKIDAILEMKQPINKPEVEPQNKIGYVIVDSNECIIRSKSGKWEKTHAKFHFEMPLSMGRGGTRALRRAQLQLEKRTKYIQIVIDKVIQYFVTEGKRNVDEIYVGVSAEFKTQLPARLEEQTKIRVSKIFDVSYGGENGYQQVLKFVS